MKWSNHNLGGKATRTKGQFSISSDSPVPWHVVPNNDRVGLFKSSKRVMGVRDRGRWKGTNRRRHDFMGDIYGQTPREEHGEIWILKGGKIDIDPREKREISFSADEAQWRPGSVWWPPDLLSSNITFFFFLLHYRLEGVLLLTRWATKLEELIPRRNRRFRSVHSDTVTWNCVRNYVNYVVWCMHHASYHICIFDIIIATLSCSDCG